MEKVLGFYLKSTPTKKLIYPAYNSGMSNVRKYTFKTSNTERDIRRSKENSSTIIKFLKKTNRYCKYTS